MITGKTKRIAQSVMMGCSVGLHTHTFKSTCKIIKMHAQHIGGNGKVTPEDIRDSNIFLDELSKLLPDLKFERAADGGAGIGRVTKLLLLPR